MTNTQAISLVALVISTQVLANDVSIRSAEFQENGDSTWSVKVTLQHADTGWDHYADGWRVVDEAGNVLGDRVLYHPHVDEQPFTRGLGKVIVPSGITTVYIEAHDKVHGWTTNRLTVGLDQAISGRLRVSAE